MPALSATEQASIHPQPQASLARPVVCGQFGGFAIADLDLVVKKLEQRDVLRLF